MADTEDTLRADLEAAFAEAEADLEPQEALEATPEPEPEPPAPEEPPPEKITDEESVATAPRRRDARGRFLPDEGHPEDVERYPNLTEDRIAKAPEGWRPATREGWDKLPETVRREIHRRELDIATGHSQSAEARAYAERVQGLLRPYEPLMAAQGVTDPLDGLNGLLRTAAALQTGSPQQKAQRIGQLIQTYGVDIEQLAQVIEGQTPTETVDPALDTRLKPIEEFMRRIESRFGESEQAEQHEAARMIQEAAPEMEFLQDVRLDMAALLDAATSQQRSLSLKDAYEMACRLNPEVRRVVEAREKAQAQNNPERKRQLARSSLSARRAGSEAPPPANGSLRGDILAAINRLESGE